MTIHSVSVRPYPALAARPDKADKREAILRAAIETSPPAASSTPRSPTSRAPPASPPAPSTSISAARTTCWSRSSSARCARRLPRAGRASPDRRPGRPPALVRPPAPGAPRPRPSLAVVFQVELRQSTKFMERFSATQLRDYLGLIREAIADGQASGAFRPTSTPRCRQDVLRRARRDGDQLDSQPAPVRSRRSRRDRRLVRRRRRTRCRAQRLRPCAGRRE